MYKTSKVGQLINKINNLEYKSLNQKPPRLKRSFDIFELDHLREAGNSWKKIAIQLYSNERAVREYYRDNKNKLNATGDHIPG